QQAQRIREHNEDMRQLMSTNTSGMASLSMAGGGGGASLSESGVAGVEEEYTHDSRRDEKNFVIVALPHPPLGCAAPCSVSMCVVVPSIIPDSTLRSFKTLC
ncbi:unnamed protein product, partial [Pylaiella littoralis]